MASSHRSLVHKLGVVLCFTLVASAKVTAQTIWSDPERLTSGGADDRNPAFAMFQWPESNAEWLAFERSSAAHGVSGISVMKLFSTFGSWSDTVYSIIEDSVGTNDQPTLAGHEGGSETDLMLLWHRSSAGDNIWYSYDSAGNWSPPTPLTQDSSINRRPNVAPRDSGFGVVFERSGRVAFSEFVNGRWSGLSYVALHDDTMNSSPQLWYLDSYGHTASPMVVWEHRKSPDTARALLYSIRSDTGWSYPDTIAAPGDNRHPKFFKPQWSFHVSISWESNRSGRWEIYGSSGYGWPFTWYLTEERLNASTNSDVTEGSFMSVPIITANGVSRPSQYFPYFTAGTWRVESSGGDSIAVAGWQEFREFGGTNAGHPDISGGVQDYGGLRVWSVWESSDSGIAHLYASTTVIVVGVKDDPALERDFRLMQNYPNPFNPSTRISYTLPSQSDVRLAVCDLLGRELSTLVNERKPAGVYSVEWNGAVYSSGVYFCRLRVSSPSDPTHPFVQTKKMILLR